MKKNSTTHNLTFKPNRNGLELQCDEWASSVTHPEGTDLRLHTAQMARLHLLIHVSMIKGAQTTLMQAGKLVDFLFSPGSLFCALSSLCAFGSGARTTLVPNWRSLKRIAAVCLHLTRFSLRRCELTISSSNTFTKQVHPTSVGAPLKNTRYFNDVSSLKLTRATTTGMAPVSTCMDSGPEPPAQQMRRIP